METSLSESVQQLVRPGKCVDAYYPDPETAQKACFRTTQNTRYIQAFANLTGGSSVLTIPANNGVQDIVVIMEFPAPQAPATYAGLGLNRGWGYALIKQVSFRYGGSSQYFLTGQQLLQNALRQMSNGSARDDLLALGGAASSAPTAAQRAYCWLSLPHCIPTSEGKLPPLPSDLLTQPIQITIELFPVGSVWSAAAGATGTIPSSLSFAEFQVQQVILENQGDALARRVDMTTNALSFPVNFVQQEVLIPLANSVSQQVTLTGFRSGEVKSIQCWITKGSDTSGAVKNPFRWYAPEDAVMSYAGEIYARFDKGSGALWNLVNGRITPVVQDVLLTDVAGVISITTPSVDAWLELPFGQTYDPLTAHSFYMAGKPITNGIVQFTFNLPAAASPAADYVLHVSYCYNSVLTFSQGTAEYVI